MVSGKDVFTLAIGKASSENMLWRLCRECVCVRIERKVVVEMAFCFLSWPGRCCCGAVSLNTVLGGAAQFRSSHVGATAVPLNSKR